MPSVVFVRFNKAVVPDDPTIVKHRILGSARPLRIIKVHVVETKLLGVSRAPFKVVHDGPGSVGYDVTSVLFNG